MSAKKNLFDFSAKLLSGELQKLSAYRGKVVLIENVASLWGTTTRDYSQMNQLVDMFGSKLQVLAFPCNQFGFQENTRNEEILNSLKYVRPGNSYVPKFPIFAKSDVNGQEANPIFQFLKESLPFPHDDQTSLMANPKYIIWEPVLRTDVSWNFEKFLISPDGVPYKRYSREYQTIDIQEDIKQLIEKYAIK